MSLFTNLLGNNLIHAIGWTILHSFWQIAIIGTILSALLFLFKRKSSVLKYYLSVAAMLVTIILSLFTFFQQYSSLENVSILYEDIPANEMAFNQTENTNFEKLLLSQLTLKEKVKLYVNNNLQIIVSIWYLCVFLLFLKMIAGLIYSQRMKKYGTSAVSIEWSEILERLTKKLKINKSIKLLESVLVKIPVAIGFLKPVILLPVGIASGLSVEQLEAILAHELAHIKRNDYLINLLQSLLEILFFYHPVVWWISKKIRNERENACDDIVISLQTDRIVLAKALANIEFINKKQNQYVMALNGNKNNILKRISRLVDQPKTGFSYKEGLVGISLIMLSLIVMSFSINTFSKISGEQAYKNQLAKTIIAKPGIKLNQNSESSLPENNFDNTMIHAKNEKLIDDTIVTINQEREILYKVNKTTNYRILFDENREMYMFFLNGNQIPKANWKDYQQPIDKMLEIFQAYLAEKDGKDEKNNIINELIAEMKNDGSIDKNAIGYKVYFYYNYMTINDKRQSEEVFQKYKKLFDEKAKGKYKLDFHWNVNQNFIRKTEDEFKEMQLTQMKEYIAQQEELRKKQYEILEKQEKMLKKQKDEFVKQEKELKAQTEYLIQMDLKLKQKEKELQQSEQELKAKELELKEEKKK